MFFFFACILLLSKICNYLTKWIISISSFYLFFVEFVLLLSDVFWFVFFFLTIFLLYISARSISSNKWKQRKLHHSFYFYKLLHVYFVNNFVVVILINIYRVFFVMTGNCLQFWLCLHAFVSVIFECYGSFKAASALSQSKLFRQNSWWNLSTVDSRYLEPFFSAMKDLVSSWNSVSRRSLTYYVIKKGEGIVKIFMFNYRRRGGGSSYDDISKCKNSNYMFVLFSALLQLILFPIYGILSGLSHRKGWSINTHWCR